jgi:hypothetical protein
MLQNPALIDVEDIHITLLVDLVHHLFLLVGHFSYLLRLVGIGDIFK